MATGYITYTSTLDTKECPTCGMLYAAPQDFFGRCNTDNAKWYCPRGHGISYRDSKLARAKRQLAEAQERADRLERQRRRVSTLLTCEQRSHRSTKGHLTRSKRRHAAGVCPYCSRTFQQVQRHIKSQHPDKETE